MRLPREHVGRLNLSRGSYDDERDLDENVIALNLRENKLTELPDLATVTPALVELDVSVNMLDALPSQFSANLCIINVASNRISEIPDSICDLLHLEELLLSNNRIIALPERLGELRSLLRLDVAHNLLTTLPDTIVQLSELRVLDVSENLLTHLPRDWTPLLRLYRLELGDNQLCHLPPSLGSVSSLRRLNCNGNPLISPPAKIVYRGRAHMQAHLRAKDKSLLTSIYGNGVGLDTSSSSDTLSLAALDTLHCRVSTVSVQTVSEDSGFHGSSSMDSIPHLSPTRTADMATQVELASPGEGLPERRLMRGEDRFKSATRGGPQLSVDRDSPQLYDGVLPDLLPDTARGYFSRGTLTDTVSSRTVSTNTSDVMREARRLDIAAVPTPPRHVSVATFAAATQTMLAEEEVDMNRPHGVLAERVLAFSLLILFVATCIGLVLYPLPE